ncbi:MAG TPA: hypothetical protein VF032_08360 [Thermoleophilaceae bacterium]
MALLCPDLLFGSNVEGGLRAAGHEVTRFASVEEARSADADVLVVDLTSDVDERVGLGHTEDVRTLAFYSHVEHDTRVRAQDAGFDLVVPRSRMAREMGALVDRLASQ